MEESNKAKKITYRIEKTEENMGKEERIIVTNKCSQGRNNTWKTNFINEIWNKERPKRREKKEDS